MQRQAALKAIRNFVAIDTHIGTAGQPTREQFPIIAAAGYTCIINLAMPDHREAIPDEAAIVTGLGMDYIHLPVPFDAPTPDQVRRFCDIMEARIHEKVFVHCIMNYRVAAFLYLYFRHRRDDEEQAARSPMLTRWQPDETWQALLAWDADTIRT